MYRVYLNGDLYAFLQGKSASHVLRNVRRTMPNKWAYTLRGKGERTSLISRYGGIYTVEKVY